MAKADIENCDPQHGKGRKHNRGRTDRDLTPEQHLKQVKLAISVCRKNGVTPLLKHILPEEIKKGWGMLEAHTKYWMARNEDHLAADWMKDLVDRLVTAGVTRQMVSLFSLAYAVIDRLTSSVRRTQCMLGCLASMSHVFEGCARDRVDKDNKNYKKLARGAKGVDIHHKKSIHVWDMYVVLIVICRPLMRKLLQLCADELAIELDEMKAKPMGPRETPAGRRKRIDKLCVRVEEARGRKLGETTSPFDEDGRSLCKTAYTDLLRFVGVHCFGIPNWGAHIARTEHTTLVHSDAVRKGMPVDHPDVSQVGWSACHGGESQVRFYDDQRNRDGGSRFVQGHGGILQSLEFMTEEPGGTPPPSTELPPVTGDPLACCFFRPDDIVTKWGAKCSNNYRRHAVTTEPSLFSRATLPFPTAEPPVPSPLEATGTSAAPSTERPPSAEPPSPPPLMAPVAAAAPVPREIPPVAGDQCVLYFF